MKQRVALAILVGFPAIGAVYVLALPFLMHGFSRAGLICAGWTWGLALASGAAACWAISALDE